MNRHKYRLIVSALMLVVSWSMTSRAAENEQATLESLRELQGRTETDTGLPDVLRERIIELCDGGITALEAAEMNRAAAIGLDRERGSVERIVANLRSELDHTIKQPRPHLPDEPTVEQAENALDRERARLSANLTALRDQQRAADDRTQSRLEISKRLGELDHEVEVLNRELRAQAEITARTELKTAARLNVLARREAADAEIELLRARLALLADRSSLVPLNIDLAQRRVEAGRELVDLLAEIAREVRIAAARRSLNHVRETSRQLAESVPQLAGLAAETEELAEILWGATDGIVTLDEQAVRDLAATRIHQMQLNRISALTVRKFSAYGHRGSIQRWWPDIPEDFPEINNIVKAIELLDGEIPEVEHRLITAEQERAKAHVLARTTLRDLADELGDELSPELEAEIRAFLAMRQDVLDELINRGGRFSSQLVEYRKVLGSFLGRVREVERFLFSHVLWSRSVPRPIIPRFRDLIAAFGWVIPASHTETWSVVYSDFRGDLLPLAFVLVLVILVRRPLRRRLNELADRVSDPERDTMGLTLQALVITGILASPMPLALLLTGSVVDRMGQSAYWFASADAFLKLATVAVLLELIRQIFAPRGLAEVHFGWPTSATRPLYRGLLITEAAGMPLLYVALHFAFAGISFSSPAELQLHNNTLGRLAFIAAMSVFGVAILSMLRPEKKTEPSDHEMWVPWPRRFSSYAFPTAFLGAYPMVIFTTIVPALLAAFGFYVTGLLLAHQMLRTLTLAVVVLIVGGVIQRSRSIRQRQMLLASDDDVADDTALREFETTDKQARHLFRFAVVAVLAVGLYGIWSDALPMLEALKRIQIFPRIAVLETTDDPAAALIAPTQGDDGISTRNADAAPTETQSASPVTGPMPAPAAPSETTAHESVPLTIWILLEAILAALVTLALVRNLPGVIEIILKRRTTLDSGARFAFTTLVRYSITIIGAVAVFSLLGIGWAKVQWLAAALTFGLGFGLQEIVANFVSGLILLIERPIRVGDVVTIGNLMGKVSRIQIRATTITLWDRSEMIVPNKEFITTKLVNWTLSDSKRRIEIPLRVAYGADLEQVKSLLIGTAETHPLVLKDPAPQALLLTFGDDAINFELRFVVDFGNGIRAKDDVQMAIDLAFKEHGIEFALPQLKLQLPEEADPEENEPPEEPTTA